MLIQRRKLIALTLAIGGLAGLVGTAYGERREIQGWWYARKLDSDDPAVRTQGLEELTRLGSPRGLSRIRSCFPESQPAMYSTETKALFAYVKGQGRAAVPHFRKAFEEADPFTREFALLLLSNVGVAEEDVPFLIPVLRYEDRGGSPEWRAALLLGKLGSAAAPAVPDLCRLVSHRIDGVRAEAVKALGMIGVRSEEVLRVLKTALSQKYVGSEAEQALNLLEGAKIPVDPLDP